ncbi:MULTISPECIES: helix-turn-helix transcriptional regulator [Cytobacillus]|uniref:helix-turn-helix transcriptional regulator n=1 Tax=Cytobacillus TaxID=2675230 RepID=UPI00203E8AC8|nr:helix-turn-helix transcriptional regulator [Cytobacillus firmus]MCM3705845.1 helix-turn-helix domain-containing protein [Cytobacillus firmus]
MNANSFKGLRLKKGMTQKEYADLLGVSESTIAAIETGRRPISDLVRARLAQKIELDEDSIYFLESFEKVKRIYPS